MMTITETPVQPRNIHFSQDVNKAEVGEESARAPFVGRFRKVTRSPNEEFAARVEQYGQPVRIPRSVVALVLKKKRWVTVKPSGILLEINKMKLWYWHQNSATCANRVGQRVLALFDPDDLACIEIMQADGVWMESIPQKEAVAWFDEDATRAQAEAKGQVLKRQMEDFLETHKPTVEEKDRRILANAEKMQIVNTLPHPEAPIEQPVAREHAKDFVKADLVESARDILRARRTTVRNRSDRLSRFRAEDLSKSDRDGDVVDEPVQVGRFSADALL
jgi:hypothetical protein